MTFNYMRFFSPLSKGNVTKYENICSISLKIHQMFGGNHSLGAGADCNLCLHQHLCFVNYVHTTRRLRPASMLLKGWENQKDITIS